MQGMTLRLPPHTGHGKERQPLMREHSFMDAAYSRTPGSSSPSDVSDDELVQVIADFLSLGHVENIVAMFRQEPKYYQWTGLLLNDDRYAVRLGLSVLFEHLAGLCPSQISLAIPSLAAQLDNSLAWVRGESLSILAIIGTPEALALVPAHLYDPSPQVAEIAHDILGIPFHG